MLSPECPTAEAFQGYLDAASSLPDACAQSGDLVAAVELSTKRAAEQLEGISERIAELRERLEKLAKARKA